MDLSGSEIPYVPSPKRVKIEDEGGDELDGDHCSICLQLLLDRTVIPECSHEFCYDCIVTWTEQSRRCPLCTRTIGPYLIHNIRSNYDYQKYHLLPLRSSPPPIRPLRRARGASIRRPSAQERRWGRRERRDQDVADELERAIDRRRWIYHNHLYAKHVGSNTFSRYRPFPTSAQFSASPDHTSRATIFIRRELRVWPNLDVEFLTTFILSLMKAIDIRSESAIKLLSEFLDMDRPYNEGGRFPNAEHFAHVFLLQKEDSDKGASYFPELYSFLRSPYKSLSAYDMNVQYDEAEGAYGHTLRKDDRTAPERPTNYEAPSSDRLRTRRRSRSRSHERAELRDGGRRSRSKSNDHICGDKLEQGSSASVTGNEPGASPQGNGDSNNGRETLHVAQMADDPPRHAEPEEADGRPASSSQVNRKGKQRATTAVLDDLVTHVNNNGHGHVGDEGAPGTECSVDRNASVHGKRHVADDQTGDPKKQRAFYQDSSQTTAVNSRTRNPLLIAQMHLLKSGDKGNFERGDSSSPGNSSLISHLRRSQDEGKRPSLLLRIGTTNLSSAQANETATEVPEPSVEATDVARPEISDFRTKLLRHLDAERFILASQERMDGSPLFDSSTRRNPVGGHLSGTLEGSGPGNVEAVARARARLRMKSTLEKHNYTSDTRLGSAGDRVSEEKSNVSGNREDMLRSLLEHRRRYG